MSYKDKPQIKLYKYENSEFKLIAIIDDYQECSFEHKLYEAGQFTITINYNIPNARLFERGLWVQFGNKPFNFGEISNISDSIGEQGKASQTRVITGYDARRIFSRRVIKSLNNNNTWSLTAKGELCIRQLVADQCGANAEEKRKLPVINVIPENPIGAEYSVSESFTNLYETLVTIATQSKIGWRVVFDGENLTLECYEGTDRHSTVQFSTEFDSLSNGQFTDSSESFTNAVYVGGKGSGEDRDIYEGEQEIEGETPEGLDRYESWDNQSSMTTEEEYEAEAKSILSQYGQTLQVSGQGLVQCPYIYGEQYDVGDIITIEFSGKSAQVQILSVSEHWVKGSYALQFEFGKPLPDLSKQLQLMLKQIQKASEKATSTESVKWYTMPTDITMSKADVTYNTIGFVGACASGGSTFTLYLDDEKTGAKTYHVYFKELSGGTITFTTGKSGASNLTLNNGTYVAIIYVDENGNVTLVGSTSVDSLVQGSYQPVTSGAVFSAVNTINGNINTINGDITNINGDITDINGDITDINGNITNINSAVNTLNTNVSNLPLNAVTTCSTGASTRDKAITLSGHTLKSGDIIAVTFTNANTYGDCTLSTPTYPRLKVNNGTAYQICDNMGHSAGTGCWEAGNTVVFMFTGNKFIILNSIIRQQNKNETSGYTIYADNKIRQWGTLNANLGGWVSISANSPIWTYPVPVKTVMWVNGIGVAKDIASGCYVQLTSNVRTPYTQFFACYVSLIYCVMEGFI